MASPIVQAIKQICEEKNIAYESVIETVEAALAAAYRKDFGEKNQNIKVNFDPETAAIRVFDVKTVVEDMELPEEEAVEVGALESKPAPAKKRKSGASETAPTVPKTESAPGAEGAPVEEEKKWNPKIMIMISEAKKLKPDAAIDEEIRTELSVPGPFGRMAAQTAKQVIMQKLREAEREVVYNEYKNKEGSVVVATVQRWEGRVVLWDLGRTTAVMPPEEQVSSERYLPGERMKVYIPRVAMTSKGPEIVASRTHPEFVRKLFTIEIPEVASGAVEIKAVAREAGGRSKVAVATTEPSIDPIGSCIGQRGTRIQTIIAELGGEKIDVIAWAPNPEVFIVNALSPAKVAGLSVDQKEQIATVRVVSDQLSLAIGRGGQNVRLAAKLTGWKINVVEEKSKSEAGEKTPDPASEAESTPPTSPTSEESSETPEEGTTDAEEDVKPAK